MVEKIVVIGGGLGGGFTPAIISGGIVAKALRQTGLGR
jgi:hypothetical protein